MGDAAGDGVILTVLATASAVSALSFAVAAAGAWSAMAKATASPAGALFLRVACAVLLLSTVHHATDLATALGHASHSTQAVTGAALASMGAIASGYVVRYGWLMRHMAEAPGLLGGAIRRASVAESALGEVSRRDMGALRRIVDAVAGRTIAIDTRISRDADAGEIIQRMMQRIGVASAVAVGGELVISAANDAFWAMGANGVDRGHATLATALGLDSRDAARLSRLAAREGASLVVEVAGADGGVDQLELTTEYLPREDGGRMWVSCRSRPRTSPHKC